MQAGKKRKSKDGKKKPEIHAACPNPEQRKRETGQKE